MSRLEGKVALVTSSAQGIGATLAREYLLDLTGGDRPGH